MTTDDLMLGKLLRTLAIARLASSWKSIFNNQEENEIQMARGKEHYGSMDDVELMDELVAMVYTQGQLNADYDA